MRALTLWPEWAWAIINLDKNVENRVWPGPVYNKSIALHAGKKIGGSLFSESDSVFMMTEKAIEAGWSYQKSSDPWNDGNFEKNGMVVEFSIDAVKNISGRIFALAEIESCIMGSTSAWAAEGQWNWLLKNIHILKNPVPCRGQQGLWYLPSEVEAEVLAEISK